MNEKDLKSKKGITLIALTVTIVVLIILASISIGVLGGEDGLINQAKLAKEETEISEEKELLGRATVQAAGKDVYGNIEEESLQKELDKEAGEGKTEVTDIGEEFEVIFKENNRYYIVDKDGNIGEAQEIIEDKNPGDITKDKDGNELDGSEEKPYEIWCIEDLVVLSNMVNGEGIKFENGNSIEITLPDKFSGKYVNLMSSLNFKSTLSYNDANTTQFGDLNKDGIIEDIKTELTKTNEGCIGFTAIGVNDSYSKIFEGIFDGKNNEIRNIYQNYNEAQYSEAGLFGNTNNGEIKNLTITGNIINNTWHAGGISSGGTSNITNCKNYANITGYNMVGGICAYPGTNGIIANCINYGDIKITGKDYQYGGAGGIIGCLGYNRNVVIENCINEGNLIGDITKAGIVGHSNGGKIISCINKGNGGDAGICSWTASQTTNIINCYNLGKSYNGIVKDFRGASWDGILELNIKNCYNLGKVTNSGIVGEQGTICASITLNIENCYNAGLSTNAIIGKITTDSRTTTITNISNTYYDSSKSTNIGAISEGITNMNIQNNTSFVDILNNNIGSNEEWKHWKLSEDGYPTFE